MVVDAARRWWAANRPRQLGVTVQSGVHETTIARWALILPPLVVGAILLCATFGFTATRISQGRVEAQQRAALQQTLDRLRGQFGELSGPDAVQLRESRAEATSAILLRS
jgi:hypothetical protein